MKPLYIVSAFSIAVVAAGLTLALRPHASVHETTTAMAAGETSVRPDGKVPSVADMVTGLEQRLEKEPDDGKGWLLLAKSYQFLNQPADARKAYEKADALGNSDPVLAAQLYGLSPQ